MAPTAPHRRRHHAARCLLAAAALCGSPHATQAFLVPGLNPTTLAPLPSSRARLVVGQPASASPGVGLASSSSSRLYARQMGGGVDPPFQFGGGDNDNSDENDGFPTGRSRQSPQGSSSSGRQQRRPQQPPQPPSASSSMTPPAAKATAGTAGGPLKLQGFMEGSQSLVPQVGGMPFMTGNNYVDLIVTMSPKEMIANFKAAAPPRVQEAVKRTVLRCIGSIQDSLVEDSHRTTGLIFANLLYKAQVTGYMLFNAEAKVQNILGSLPLGPVTDTPLPSASSAATAADASTTLLGMGEGGLLQGSTSAGSVMVGAGTAPEEVMKLQGLIKITTSDGQEVEVQASEYVEALKAEAAQLRAELVRMEEEKRQLVSRDLLSYISDLSARQSAELTSGMTQDVVEAMKMLVNRVLASLRDHPIVEKEAMELDSAALAQLIMWGLVTGYSLRELEKAWAYGRPVASPSLLQPPIPPTPQNRPRGRRGGSGGGPPPPPRGSGGGNKRGPRGGNGGGRGGEGGGGGGGGRGPEGGGRGGWGGGGRRGGGGGGGGGGSGGGRWQ